MFAMTSLQSGTEILKTDQRGRVRTPRPRREELLAEFDRSGLSGPKFAELTGVKYQTLAGWLHRRRKQPSQVAATKAPGVQWLETVIERAQAPALPSNTMLIVRLPSGAMLELSHPTQAALAGAVLRAWEKASC
jgi:hypothetical protein